jgi:hypothetical protein
MSEQIDVELQQRVIEFEEEVERAIEAYATGKGANLEAGHRARAVALGYNPEIVGRAWGGAEQPKLAVVEAPLKRRKLPPDPVPVFISPAPQPAAEPEPKHAPVEEPAPSDEPAPGQEEPEGEEAAHRMQ